LEGWEWGVGSGELGVLRLLSVEQYCEKMPIKIGGKLIFWVSFLRPCEVVILLKVCALEIFLESKPG
jgi:hypothetical protein